LAIVTVNFFKEPSQIKTHTQWCHERREVQTHLSALKHGDSEIATTAIIGCFTQPCPVVIMSIVYHISPLGRFLWRRVSRVEQGGGVNIIISVPISPRSAIFLMSWAPHSAPAGIKSRFPSELAAARRLASTSASANAVTEAGM